MEKDTSSYRLKYQHVQIFLIFVIVAFGVALVSGIRVPEDSEPWLEKVWVVLLLLISPGTIAEFIRRDALNGKEKKDESPTPSELPGPP